MAGKKVDSADPKVDSVVLANIGKALNIHAHVAIELEKRIANLASMTVSDLKLYCEAIKIHVDTGFGIENLSATWTSTPPSP